jgi:hypothetical protein
MMNKRAMIVFGALAGLSAIVLDVALAVWMGGRLTSDVQAIGLGAFFGAGAVLPASVFFALVLMRR